MVCVVGREGALQLSDGDSTESLCHQHMPPTRNLEDRLKLGDGAPIRPQVATAHDACGEVREQLGLDI